MADLWRDFLRDLGKPEYLHVLLNPLPVYGLAAAILAFAASLAVRSRPAQVIGLALIAVMSGSAWLAVWSGGGAYDRVYSMSSPEAQHWLDWHASLADWIAWADTLAGLAALLTLLLMASSARGVGTGLLLTLVFSILGLAAGGFLAFVGGKIRHPEFRHGPPPVMAPSRDG